MPTEKNNDQWRPPSHVAPEGMINGILFNLRLIFDLQVHTVYYSIRRQLQEASGHVLEVGPGDQPYVHLLPKGVHYQALDWEGAEKCFSYKAANVVYYDGENFPFDNQTFDLVYHTEVLEHIYKTQNFINQCFRVLKDGGRMIFTVPFSARVHYIPHDYWRFTPFALRKLLEESGFKDIVIEPRGNDITVAMVKLNTVLFRLMFYPHRQLLLKAINVVIAGLLSAPFILIFTACAYLALMFRLGSCDDPLGYSVFCRKQEKVVS